MIRRRWRLVLALTLLLLVGGLALVPGVRWPVYGWLRGEHFYKGMPTSYWASVLKASANESETFLLEPSAGVAPPPGIVDQVKQWLGWDATARNRDSDDYFEGDAASLPVLDALARHPDPAIRLQAMQCFASMAQTNPGAAVPYLVPALKDSDRRVRHQAAITLYLYAPEQLTTSAIPLFVEILSVGTYRMWAAQFLGDLGPGARQATPALLAALAAEAADSEAHQKCAEALRKIDPEAADRAGVK